MEKITVLMERIKAAENFHRLFQSLVALLSNKRAGVDIKKEDFRIQYIYKYQGGVRVGNSEVVIGDPKHGEIHCYDDYKYDNRKEPDIVEGVVKYLIENIDWVKFSNPNHQEYLEDTIFNLIGNELGLTKQELYNILSNRNPYSGDPLRSFFES